MISKQTIYSFCCEDISLIENYDNAINDEYQTWHCHHRLEIQENGTTISKQELINAKMYYNRPASELIFLTPAEHISLHNSVAVFSNERLQKLRNAAYGNKRALGWKPTETTRLKMSESAKRKPQVSSSTKNKLSELMKGKNNPMYGKHQKQYNWLTPEGIIKIMALTPVKRFHTDWKLIGEA